MTKRILFLITFCTIANSMIFGQHPSMCQHFKSGSIHTGNWVKGVADNSRSDTIDILKFIIDLDITDFNLQEIRGNTRVIFSPKLNGVDKILLDLLSLQVDSVLDQNGLMNYTHNDTTITIDLGNTLNSIAKS